MSHSPRYVKACETVRQKGRDAYANERKPEFGMAVCPYPDTRKNDGRLTFSRHWRKTWFEGYREAQKIAEAMLKEAARVLGPVSPGPLVQNYDVERPGR